MDASLLWSKLPVREFHESASSTSKEAHLLEEISADLRGVCIFNAQPKGNGTAIGRFEIQTCEFTEVTSSKWRLLDYTVLQRGCSFGRPAEVKEKWSTRYFETVVWWTAIEITVRVPKSRVNKYQKARNRIQRSESNVTPIPWLIIQEEMYNRSRERSKENRASSR